MKRLIAILLIVLIFASFSVTAYAAYNSNQGGNHAPSGGGSSSAPQTGSGIVLALAAVACGAGGVFAYSRKQSK